MEGASGAGRAVSTGGGSGSGVGPGGAHLTVGGAGFTQRARRTGCARAAAAGGGERPARASRAAGGGAPRVLPWSAGLAGAAEGPAP